MDATTAAPASEVSKDAKTMAMLSHLLAIFFGFIPPLIIWLVKKQESPFIEDQSKEALNFQITMVMAWVVCIILMFVIIGVFLMPILGIANLVLCIIAALKANEGVAYRYPFAIRLIK